MPRPHLHKAIKAKKQIYGWNYCVSCDLCAAQPTRQRAHGGITYHDTCSCGAIRKTESNGTATNYGPWTEAEDNA